MNSRKERSRQRKAIEGQSALVMDEHTAHIVRIFNRKIKERSFDQYDYEHFCASVRDYAPRKSALREIGDFLAHPKLKTKGESINSIRKAKSDFDSFLIEYYGRGIEKEFIFEGFGGGRKLLEDISAILMVAGLSDASVIDECSSVGRDIIFCTIFCLGQFALETVSSKDLLEISIVDNTKLYLSVTLESDLYPRHRVSLGFLSVQIGRDLVPFSRGKARNFIARRLEEGPLCAISYESDNKLERINFSTLEGSDYIILEDMQSLPR